MFPPSRNMPPPPTPFIHANIPWASLEAVGWSLAQLVNIIRSLHAYPSTMLHSEGATPGEHRMWKAVYFSAVTQLLLGAFLIAEWTWHQSGFSSSAQRLEPTYSRPCRTIPCQKGPASPPLRLPPRSRSLIRTSLNKYFHFPVSWPSGLLSNMLWEG